MAEFHICDIGDEVEAHMSRWVLEAAQADMNTGSIDRQEAANRVLRETACQQLVEFLD
jgi:hypothetical protein